MPPTLYMKCGLCGGTIDTRDADYCTEMPCPIRPYRQQYASVPESESTNTEDDQMIYDMMREIYIRTCSLWMQDGSSLSASQVQEFLLNARYAANRFYQFTH